MPLNEQTENPQAANFCRHCTDEAGQLKPRADVQRGVASWMTEWQGVSFDVAMKRADHFLRAMPAFATD
jgi:hypothetical protein